MQLSEITTLLAATGLAYRGGFCPIQSMACPSAAIKGAGGSPRRRYRRRDLAVLLSAPEAGDGARSIVAGRGVSSDLAAATGAMPIYPFGGPPC
jgi:hypothetical protein